MFSDTITSKINSFLRINNSIDQIDSVSIYINSDKKKKSVAVKLVSISP